MAPTTFAVVGSGRRCRFFLRIAAAAPDRLRAVGIVSRDPERVEPGVRAFRTLDELLAGERPDFVAAAVPWPQMPDVARAAVALGVPVLVETPPAPDLDGLRALWSDVGGSGLVQVAEQYLLMPGSFEETLDWVIAYRLDGLRVSEKAFSHTTEAEIADLAQRTSDLGLRLELAGPSVKPGRGGNTVASLRHLSQALCKCRSAGGSTLVEGEV